jgi:predicted small lipoprotein YifL
MTPRALLAILLISGLLAACGVKGKPELPEGAKSNRNDQIILDPLIK